jgi:hypothetical protein
MNVESISVPAERVPDMSGSSKAVAGVLFFVAVICGFAAMGVGGDEKTRSFTDNPSDTGEKTGMILGAVALAGIPGLFGFRAARNASRATRAAQIAKTEPSYTWRLSGKYIIAADPAGVPHPELSFKVNAKNRTMLLALPRAEVVDRHG